MSGDAERDRLRRLRILFFLATVNYDRVFEAFVRELLRRGHEVTILVEGARQTVAAGFGESFAGLAREYPDTFRLEAQPRRDTARAVAAHRVRLVLDYLRYLEPEYAAAASLRARSRRRLGRLTAAACDLACRSARRRAGAVRLVRAVEQALPPDQSVEERIRREAPDIVLVAPLIALGSSQADVLRSARRAGVPTVFPVASWDNLTNKGLVRDVPTQTVVWNEAQVDEAVTLQRLPRERVHAVGAHAYDHWFEWSGGAPRTEFMGRVGLDPSRPFLLYACSSAFIAGDETGFVREWLDRLRAAGGALAEVGVLVRPHPHNGEIWLRSGGLDDERTVVWPPGGEAPTDPSRKTGYFDSIRHASGVVAVNTSVVLEAAIARTPVFSITTDRYRGTQSGTLHFGYVAGEDGVLNLAATWSEHLRQLAAACEDPEPFARRAESFQRRFLRPHGLDTPAAPLAADVVERAAGERPAAEPPARRRATAAARALIALTAFERGARSIARRLRQSGREA